MKDEAPNKFKQKKSFSWLYCIDERLLRFTKNSSDGNWKIQRYENNSSKDMESLSNTMIGSILKKNQRWTAKLLTKVIEKL